MGTSSSSSPSRARLARCLLGVALLATSLAKPSVATADVNPATRLASLACDVESSLSGRFAGAPLAAVGSSVTLVHRTTLDAGTVYQDILQRPDGSTYVASALTVRLPLASGVEWAPAPTEFTIGGTVVPLTAGTGPVASGFTYQIDASDPAERSVTVFFPGDVATQLSNPSGAGVPSYQVGSDGTEIRFAFDGTVTSPSAAGAVVDAARCEAGVSTGPSNRASQSGVATLAIGQPAIAVRKSASLPVVSPGDIAEWTIEVEALEDAPSGGPVLPARDVTAVDTLPAGLTPVDDDGDPLADGATAGGGTWNAAARTLTFAADPVALGETVTFTYRTMLDVGAPSSVTLQNVVDVEASPLPGVVPGETISSASAQASIDTAPEGPSITKTVDVDATYLGGPVRYQVEITLPADSGPFFDLTVMDDLPDGLRFGDTVSADCTGCGTAPSVRSLDPSDSATGTRTGWSLGDLPRQAAPRRIVITYDASLAQTYADGSPIPLDTVFENTATLGVNTTDRLGDATPSTDAPPTFDLFDSASTPVRYGRPVLSLDKRLHSSENAASIIPDNDGVRYELVVTNTGSAPATNVAVRDTPGEVFASFNPLSGPIDHPRTASEPWLGWTLPGPIQPGESVIIAYRATLRSSLPALPVAENSAYIETYSDLGEETDYPATSPDTLSVPIAVPNPQLTKTLLTPIPEGAVPTTGASLAYRLSFANPGLVPVNTFICDSLPQGWEATTPLPTLPNLSVSYYGPTSSCSIMISGLMPAGYAATLDYTLVANTVATPLVTPGPQTNVVTMNANAGPVTSVGGESLRRQATVTVDAIKPTVTLSKTPDEEDGEFILVGGSTSFELNVTNTSTVSATNLTVDDLLPSSLRYTAGSFTSQTVGSGTSVVTDVSPSTTNPRFRIDRIAPGDRVRIVVPVNHTGAAPPANRLLVNSATVTAPTMTTSSDTGTISVQANLDAPTVTKTADVSAARPGETFDYSVEVKIPANAVDMNDLLVVDTLPDGISYVGPVAVTCDSGCGGAGVEFTGVEIPLTAMPDGSQKIGWFFGDVTGGSTASTWTLTFPAQVDVTFDGLGSPAAGEYVAAGVAGSDPLINRAQAFFNATDVIGAAPATLPTIIWQGRSRVARADIKPLTPSLKITKSVDDDRVEVGTGLTWTIAVENVGNADAFDVAVDDDLAGGVLRDLTFDPSNPATPTLDAAGAHFVIPSVPAGDTVELVYRAFPPLSVDLDSETSGSSSSPVVLTNTATVVQYGTVAGAGAGNVVYTPPTTDDDAKVIVDTPIAALGASITNAAAVCETAEEGEVWRYRTTAGNTGSGTPDLAGSTAIGYDPVLRITIPAGVELVPNTLQLFIDNVASALVPTIVAQPDGSLRIEWDDLPDVPSLRTDFFRADMQLKASADNAPMTSTVHEIWLHDASGELARSANAPLGEYAYYAVWSPGCFPSPMLVKEPVSPGSTTDRLLAADVAQGAPYDWHVTIATSRGSLGGVVLKDVLPAGVTYVGGASLSPSKAWSETVEPLGDGRTRLTWTLGEELDPSVAYDLTIPTTISATAPVGVDLVNAIDMFSDSAMIAAGCAPGTLCDTGAVRPYNPVEPRIVKSTTLTDTVLYGDAAPFTVDVMIPAGRTFDELLVTEAPNWRNYDRDGVKATTYSQSDVHYVDAYCVSGCTNTGPGSTPSAADDVHITTLTPATVPVTVYEQNQPQMGWYLQTPFTGTPTRNLAASSQDRVIRMTFTVNTPLLTTAQVVSFNDGKGGTRLQDMTIVDEAKLLYSTSPGFDLPYTSAGWSGSVGGMQTLDTANAEITRTHPTVDSSKMCYDPTDRSTAAIVSQSLNSGILRPREVLPGVVNVVCEITTRNTSTAVAYGTRVTDRPRVPDADVGALWNAVDVVVPAGVAVATAPSAANDNVSAWDVDELEPGESVTVMVRYHLDFWTNPTKWGNGVVRATTNSISTDAPYWDALRTWKSGPTTGRTLTALVSRPVISPSKLAVDGTTYGKNLRDAVPGKPFTWELNLDYWGEQSLDTISIADTLPVGWTYVAGSARLIANAPRTAGATNEVAGYQVIPLADSGAPTNPTTVGGSTSCDVPTAHSGGQEIKWTFDRGSEAFSQPWMTSATNPGVFAPYAMNTPMDPNITHGFDDVFTNPYAVSAVQTPPYTQVGFGDLDLLWAYGSRVLVDPNPPYAYANAPGVADVLLANGGAYDTVEWKRLTLVFDAVPTSGAVDCIQEPGVAENFRNNLSVQATRGSVSTQITKTASADAQLVEPVTVDKTPDGGIVADGGVAEFTIEVKNHWDEAVNDLTVTDTLDGIGAFGGQYVPGSATATGGGTLAETAVTVAGDDVTVTWTIDRLEPGESTVITVPVPVPTDTADGTVIANTVAVASPDMPMDQRDGADITVRNPSPPPTPTKTMPATARPGDRFVVDVAVSTPPNAAFFDLTFADTLPDGLRFVGHRTPTCLQGTTSCDATFISPMGASVNGDGTTSIGWFFGDVNSSGLGRDYHLRYEVEVGDAYQSGGTVGDGDRLSNRVVGYANDEDVVTAAPSSVPDPASFAMSSDPAQATTEVGLPNLVIDKTASTPGPIRSGETVDYVLTIRNLGHGPARRVAVRDTPSGGVASVSPTTNAGYLTKGYSAVAPDLAWVVPTVPGGGSVQLGYRVTVTDDVTALVERGTTALDNAASILSYADGPPRTANTRSYAGGDPVETSVPYEGSGLSVAKHIGSCTSEVATVLPGANVEWCVRVTNSSTSPAQNVDVVDTLPGNFEFVAGSATVGGVADDPDVVDGSGFSTLTWSIAEIPAGESVEIRFVTSTDRQSSGSVENSVVATLGTSSGGRSAAAAARTADSARAQFAAAGSEISKTPDLQLLQYEGVGGDVTWDITVTNPQSAPLTDLVVEDQLPGAFTYVDATVDDPTWVPGSEAVGAAGSGPGGTTPISFGFAELLPGEVVTITLRAHIPSSVQRLDWFTNHVLLTAAEIPIAVENQARVGIYGPALPPTIVKSIDDPQARIGDERTYTLEATFEHGQDLSDIAVRDVVDDGLSVTGVVSAACVSGCGSSPPTPVRIGATSTPSGATTHGWWIGDLTTGVDDAVFRFVYTARVDETVADGSRTPDIGSLRNRATVLANPIPVIVDDPSDTPPESFECAGCTWHFDVSDDSSVDVIEPVLVLDHDLGCDASAEPGDGVDECLVGPGSRQTYTVRVTNNGTAAAYDVTIRDVLPDWLRDVSPRAANPGTLTHSHSASESYLEWVVAQIDVGETVELVIDVTVADDAPTRVRLDAPASVEEYFAVPAASRTPEHVAGVNPPDDVVTLEVRAPLVVLDEDVSCDASAEPGDGVDACEVIAGERVTHTLRVTNTGDGSAHDVLVTSRPGAELIGVVIGALPAGVTVEDGWLVGDPLIGFRIDEIPAGATVELTYAATVDPTVGRGVTIDTPAEVPEYFGADASERAADAASLPSPTPDVTHLTTVAPVLALDHDVDCDASAQPGDGVDECTVRPGQRVEYVVYVTNTGDVDAFDVVVDDVLPAGLLVGVTPDPSNPGTLVSDGSTPNLGWSLATLPVGETVALRFTGTVASNTATDVITSTASVAEFFAAPAADRTPDMLAGDNPSPDVTTLQIVAPTMALDLDVDCDPAAEPGDGVDHCDVVPGQPVTMRFTITNTSDETAYDVVAGVAVDQWLIDVVPDAANPGSLLVPWSSAAPTMAWGVPSLAAGESVTFVYRGLVNGATPTDVTLHDIGSIDEFFAVAEADRPVGFPSEPVPAHDQVDLDPNLPALVLDQDVSCDAAAEPGDGVDRCAVTAGDRVTYTIRVRNTGDGPAFDVVVSDLVPAGLVDVTMAAGNPGSVTDGWTLADPDVRFSVPRIDPGEEITLVYSATIDPAITGSVELSTDAEIVEAFVAPEGERTSAMPAAEIGPGDSVTLVTESPLLGVAVQLVCPDAADPCPRVPGSTVEFEVRVPNSGDADAHDALLRVLVPAGLSGVVPVGVVPGVVTDGWAVGDPDVVVALDPIVVDGELVLRFRGVVDQTAPLGQPLDIVAEIVEYFAVPSADRLPGTPSGPQPPPVTDDVVPVMPTLTLDHDLTCDSQAEPGDGVDRCVVAPGAITRGTVRIANGGTWPAYGTELHIPIPVEIGSVQLVSAGGARVESAWSTTSREIVLVLEDALDPGETWTLEWVGRVADDAPLGAWLDVPAQITESFPEPPARREPGQLAVTLPEGDVVSVLPEQLELDVDKSVSCGSGSATCSVASGTKVSYRIVVGNTNPRSIFDPVISDTAAAGVTPDTSSFAVTVAGVNRSFRIVDDYSASDPDVRLEVHGEVRPGEDIEITYVSTATSTGGSVRNEAVVESVYLVAAGERDASTPPVDTADISRTGRRPLDDAVIEVLQRTDGRPSEPSTPGLLAYTGSGLLGILGGGLVISAAGAMVLAESRRRRRRA